MNPHNDDKLYRSMPVAQRYTMPERDPIDRMFAVIGWCVLVFCAAAFLLYCLNPHSW